MSKEWIPPIDDIELGGHAFLNVADADKRHEAPNKAQVDELLKGIVPLAENDTTLKHVNEVYTQMEDVADRIFAGTALIDGAGTVTVPDAGAPNEIAIQEGTVWVKGFPSKIKEDTTLTLPLERDGSLGQYFIYADIVKRGVKGSLSNILNIRASKSILSDYDINGVEHNIVLLSTVTSTGAVNEVYSNGRTDIQDHLDSAEPHPELATFAEMQAIGAMDFEIFTKTARGEPAFIPDVTTASTAAFVNGTLYCSLNGVHYTFNDGDVIPYAVTPTQADEGKDVYIWLTPNGLVADMCQQATPRGHNGVMKIVGGFTQRIWVSAAIGTVGEVFSTWDLKYRPSAGSPRNMVRLDCGSWMDIHFMGRDVGRDRDGNLLTSGFRRDADDGAVQLYNVFSNSTAVADALISGRVEDTHLYPPDGSLGRFSSKLMEAGKRAPTMLEYMSMVRGQTANVTPPTTPRMVASLEYKRLTTGVEMGYGEHQCILSEHFSREWRIDSNNANASGRYEFTRLTGEDSRGSGTHEWAQLGNPTLIPLIMGTGRRAHAIDSPTVGTPNLWALDVSRDINSRWEFFMSRGCCDHFEAI